MKLSNTLNSKFNQPQLKSLYKEFSRRGYNKAFSFETYVNYVWNGYLKGESVFNFPDWKERI